jgi:Cft2 family RNA processing exonuclease
MGTVEELLELLEEMRPVLAKRQPKQSKPYVEKLQAKAWPASHADGAAAIAKAIGKYKFKDALATLDELTTRLNG